MRIPLRSVDKGVDKGGGSVAPRGKPAGSVPTRHSRDRPRM